jgi:hypothetical protein
MTELVAYLLAHRHKMPNRAVIACLVLAQLAPKPTERIKVEQLMELLGVTRQSYVSSILKELRNHDLVDYEAGVRGDPGFLFFRVGPPPSQLKQQEAQPK